MPPGGFRFPSRQQAVSTMHLTRVAVVSNPDSLYGVRGIAEAVCRSFRKPCVMLELGAECSDDLTIEFYVEKGVIAAQVSKRLKDWRLKAELLK